MSRDVLAVHVDPDGDDDGGGRLARLAERVPSWARVTAWVLAAVVGLGAVAVLRPWQGPAEAAPDGRRSPTPTAADDVPVAPDVRARIAVQLDQGGPPVDRVRGTLTFANDGAQPWPVAAVEVTGLGTAFVGVPARAVVAPGGTLDLPVTVIADCAVARAGAVRVVVTRPDAAGVLRGVRVENAGAARDPYAVLGTLCPRPTPGLHVTATLARPRRDGSVLTRLVNTGTRSALVTLRGSSSSAVSLAGDVPLPLDLAPGETALVRLTVVVGRCEGADTAVPALEVRAPEGWTQVEGASGYYGTVALEQELARAARAAVEQTCR